MFTNTDMSWGSNPGDDWERVRKTYPCPPPLRMEDLVEAIRRSGHDVPELVLCAYGKKDLRVPLADFFWDERALRGVYAIRAELRDLAQTIEIQPEDGRIALEYRRIKDDRGKGAELDDAIGRAAEELLAERGELTDFLESRFNDELNMGYLDGFSGWRMMKVYHLRRGLEAAPALAGFLRDRPDNRKYPFLKDDPCYLFVGDGEDAHRLAAEQPALLDACRRAGLHVVDGSCLAFWDAFDGKAYHLDIDEYPGSADDAATYGYVTLCCEDGTKRSW